MTKIYHIYAKNECLYNNLSESQFNKTWETLKGMVGLLHTDYTLEDLSYEEVQRPFMDTTEHSYWLTLTTYYDRIELKVIQNYG